MFVYLMYTYMYYLHETFFFFFCKLIAYNNQITNVLTFVVTLMQFYINSNKYFVDVVSYFKMLFILGE